MFKQIKPSARIRRARSTKICYSALFLLTCCLVITEAARDPPLRPSLRSQRVLASTRAPQQPPPSTSPLTSSSPSTTPQLQPLKPAQASTGTGSAVEVAPSATSPMTQLFPQSSTGVIAGANRTIRTADVFQNGDGYNIFVTNTCERESMKVNIKTSRPFYGVIHTRNQRQKPLCSVEGNGDTDYNLEISHVLNSQDPSYCGVIRVRRESPEDKDILSVVVVVRVHRNIELSDDKFFLLNCTNRCRKPDCSSPSANLIRPNDTDDSGLNAVEREGAPRDNSNFDGNGMQNSDTNDTRIDNQPGSDECTIWKFPWAITLFWCLGILLLAMIISHCIMCSSMVCRCVKTEVEEKEPSVYEISDSEWDSYNKRNPYRIDYDNKDIYKTDNNYEPYNLEEAQAKSRKKDRHSYRDW